MEEHDTTKDLQALLALLEDIEKELASEGEGDKGKIRELRQHCMFRLALLDKSKKHEQD